MNNLIFLLFLQEQHILHILTQKFKVIRVRILSFIKCPIYIFLINVRFLPHTRFSQYSPSSVNLSQFSISSKSSFIHIHLSLTLFQQGIPPTHYFVGRTFDASDSVFHSKQRLMISMLEQLGYSIMMKNIYRLIYINTRVLQF